MITAKMTPEGGENMTVNISIDELHIHLEERTDIHNFYPDGTGGLSESARADEGEEFSESNDSDEGKRRQEKEPDKKELDEDAGKLALALFLRALMGKEAAL